MTEIADILEALRGGGLNPDQAEARIRASLYADVGHSTLDLDRAARTGAGEVVYGEHKTPEQIADAVQALAGSGQDVLVTRTDAAAYECVAARHAAAQFHELARLISLKQTPSAPAPTTVAVVSAGTSDLRVAEEAALTAEFYDNPVLRIRDVGVAGLHRLLARVDEIRSARVVVVVAGMEGALPSVVGGLVAAPVIAVPTSIGYGAAFDGVAALLGMLTSCASGVSVVNIDNGFGAGFLANRINRL